MTEPWRKLRAPRRRGPSVSRGAALAALLLALVSSCKIPERFADLAANRLMAMWQSVRSNDAVLVYTPDVTAEPERRITVQFRTRDLQKPTYGYSSRVLAPEGYAGTASGGTWGSVWVFDRVRRSLVEVTGLREWNAEANLRILRAVIAENFREFDFSRSRGTWLGRTTEVITTTPLAPRPYRWKATSDTDARTGFVHRLQVFGEGGKPISTFETTRYQTNAEFPADEFAPPRDGFDRAVRWSVAAEANLDAERGRLRFAPLVLPDRSGIHHVQEGAPGVWGMVSDYTSPTESLVIVQWPSGVADTCLPFGRPVALRTAVVELSLQGPYVMAMWIQGGRRLVALGEINAGTLLELVESLRELGGPAGSGKPDEGGS